MQSIESYSPGHVGFDLMLKSIFDHSRQPVIVTGIGQVSFYHIHYINPAFCRMCGYTKQELIGQTPKILQGPRSNQETLSRLKRNLANGEHFSGSSINYRKDGTTYPVEWTISPLKNSAATVVGYISIQKDLSPIWKLANLLKQQHLEIAKLKYQISSSSGTPNPIEPSISQKSSKASSVGEGMRSDIDVAANETPAKNESLSAELLEDDDLFNLGGDDLFDLGGDESHAQGGELAVDAPNYLPISATEYASLTPIEAEDISDCLDLLYSAESDITVHLQNLDDASLRKQISEDITGIGAALNYLTEFENIAEINIRLGMHLTEKLEKRIPEPAIAALREFVDELLEWFKSVFVDKTADDIHYLDKSIIASGKQFLAFYR